jgi:dTDP-4-dehydrorhamnose 3,5-epimerase-like enzyme
VRALSASLRVLERYEVFDLERIVDDAGTLYVGELARFRHGPFDRIVLITGVPAGGSRGGHAHKRQYEYVICVSGGVDVRLESRGELATVELRRPGRALYLPAGYWRDLVGFAPGTVIAMLANEPFDEDDYIRDHDAFVRWEAGAP